MSPKLKSSLLLLLVLGILFSIPVATKTYYAHGALAAFLTALTVVVSVYLGPLCFVLTGFVESSFIRSVATTSDLEMGFMFVAGLVFLAAWWRAVRVVDRPSFPYLSVTCWSLISAYFWLSIVFNHGG